MYLIITEKNISARRIAEILAGNAKVTTSKDGSAYSYLFSDVVVVGLRGHVVEVDFEPGYSNWRSEDHTPRTLIKAHVIKVPLEKKIIASVQKFSRKADRVTIATDFDTEGELIGKEAYELVRVVNSTVPVDRARFSAITPEEIRNAFSKTTSLDFALAAAGEARQVIDLIWGASLTRFITLTAKRGSQNILSVGRVQSPTLAMIVDREREIEAFTPEPYWQLTLITEKEGEAVEARHAVARFTDEATAIAARDRTLPPLTVMEVKEGTKIDRAPTPFDTTAFIVAASRIGISAGNAMRIAEDLYVNGFISYPRTDNTVYPKTLDLPHILATLQRTVFSSDVAWVIANRRSQPTQGKKTSTDHPPIYPTGQATREALSGEAWKVYELVVRRFLATLSPDAEWKTMKVSLDAGSEPYLATGARLAVVGWRHVYPYSAAQDHPLPPFTVGETLPIKKVSLEEKETQPPSRFSQAKLIQVMEELGLGTKSTRHDVIGKLIARKYVEGSPLRPTLVGRAVIEALENHADTITRPEMTRMLESHMQLITERARERDDVIDESRVILQGVFDQLEAHKEEIGAEIRDQTVEELILGACPVCRSSLRIRHARGQRQFIGCSGYPDCTFNIGLPSEVWGFAVRTDEVCPNHALYHVRLVRRGARPWEIGCPLCHHIATNREIIMRLPSVDTTIAEALARGHLYTVRDILAASATHLANIAGIDQQAAERLQKEAEEAIVRLRRQSECRKFIAKHLTPRKGRSHAKVTKRVLESGIGDISDLASASPDLLKKSGMGEEEAATVLRLAQELKGERDFRAAGVPAVSVKKYQEAGFSTPRAILSTPAAFVSFKTGMSPDTVSRHRSVVAASCGINPPPPLSKNRYTKGREGLLKVKGVGEATLADLYRAGVFDVGGLLAADPDGLARAAGMSPEKVREILASATGSQGGE
ncbi:MAG: DNA topoisomerase I [Methanomicrobiales archaeon]|nr:DNA topoisomerase I [Methanomicrobiales archaeon]